MSLLNPTYLWLLALIGIPIVLHFLLRERVQKVAFSAVRFLRGHSRESLSRRKWLEWILTALRVVCIGLLVIAFARPFFQSRTPQQSTSGQRLTVVMLDVSRSMSYADRFAEEQKIAKEAIDSADSASAFRIITFADAASVRVSEAGDKSAAKDAVDHATITASGTDLPGVLERVFSDLGRRSGGGEVHLISDLQQTALPANRAAPALPAGFQFHVHAVTGGPRNAGGVAVIGAAPYVEVLPGERNVEVSARVVNHGPARDAVAQLVVGEKVVGSRMLQLPQNGEAVASISATVKEPGEHRADIEIKNPDANGKDAGNLKDAPTVLKDDNRFHFVLHVVEKIHVAIVNGHPSAAPAQDAAFFFAKALTAGEDSSFEAMVVPTLPKLDGVDVVVLSGVNTLPKEDAARLGEFIRKGGGLLIGVAPGTGIDAFNSSLDPILPARLRAAKDDGAGRFLIPADLKHPLVQRMVAEGSGDLTTAHFRTTFELKDTQDAHVVLRFDDNRPALVEKNIGHGAAMLLAAPLDLTGGDFPLRAIFVPFARESVRILSARAEQADPPALGETLAIPAGAELKTPDGASVHAAAGEDLTETISHPGFYEIKHNGQSTLYAVNVDPKESDLSAREPADVEAMVSPQQTAEVRLTSTGIERVLPPDYKIAAERHTNLGVKALFLLLALSAIELVFARFVSKK